GDGKHLPLLSRNFKKHKTRRRYRYFLNGDDCGYGRHPDSFRRSYLCVRTSFRRRRKRGIQDTVPLQYFLPAARVRADIRHKKHKKEQKSEAAGGDRFWLIKFFLPDLRKTSVFLFPSDSLTCWTVFPNTLRSRINPLI